MKVATTETRWPNAVAAPPRSSPSDRTTAPSNWAERAALVILLAAAAHWIVGATTGLSDTEAYYAAWARVPALSYYDHPPLVAWTTWLVTRMSTAPWAIRTGPVLYAIAFDALVYCLTARLFSSRAGFFAVCILTAVPVVFFTGFLLNPESLLAPLWVLFLMVLLSLRNDAAPWRPLAMGAVVGVGFLAKYTAILAVPVALLTLAVSPARRRWLRRSSFYLGGVVALAIATPVIAWNALRQWPSVHLHLSQRMTQSSGESFLSSLRRVALGQLLYFQPFLLPMLIAVLCVVVVRSRRDDRYRFLATTSIPVLAFLLTAMVHVDDSEPHWSLVGYVPLIVAGGGLLDESTGALHRAALGLLSAALLLSGVAGGLYALHVVSPGIAKRFPSYDPNADPLAETIGWDRVSAAVGLHVSRLGRGTVVAAAHNVLCGHLEVAIDDSPAVYCASQRRTEYDFIGRGGPPRESPVVFVDSARYPADPSAVLPWHVCAPAQQVSIDRSGLPQALYRIRECVPQRVDAR